MQDLLHRQTLAFHPVMLATVHTICVLAFMLKSLNMSALGL